MDEKELTEMITKQFGSREGFLAYQLMMLSSFTQAQLDAVNVAKAEEEVGPVSVGLTEPLRITLFPGLLSISS